MSYNHKTIENISVTWSDKHDAEMRKVLGVGNVYVSDWISLHNPPQGQPKTGFNIRSQSNWDSGPIYIDFDNIPYFYRHDCNPNAILWQDQLPIILEALKITGADMEDESIVALKSCPTRPRDIPIPPTSLMDFIQNLNRLI